MPLPQTAAAPPSPDAEEEAPDAAGAPDAPDAADAPEEDTDAPDQGPGLMRSGKPGGTLTPAEKQGIAVAMRLISTLIYKDGKSSKNLMAMIGKARDKAKAISDETLMVMEIVRKKMGNVFPMKPAVGLALQVAKRLTDLAVELKLVPPDAGLIKQITGNVYTGMMSELGIHPNVVARAAAAAQPRGAMPGKPQMPQQGPGLLRSPGPKAMAAAGPGQIMPPAGRAPGMGANAAPNPQPSAGDL